MRLEYAFQVDDEALMGFEDSDNENEDVIHNGQRNYRIVLALWQNPFLAGYFQDGFPTTMQNHLDSENRRAYEKMSKEYFRHTGNIHFESAYGSVDHWDSFEIYRRAVLIDLRMKKAQHKD
jgi:hypothetical protein